MLSVNISWTGPRLSSSREGYTTTRSGPGLALTSLLTISDLVKEDSGEYKCEVFPVNGNQYVVNRPANSSISLGVSGELAIDTLKYFS